VDKKTPARRTVKEPAPQTTTPQKTPKKRIVKKTASKMAGPRKKPRRKTRKLTAKDRMPLLVCTVSLICLTLLVSAGVVFFHSRFAAGKAGSQALTAEPAAAPASSAPGPAAVPEPETSAPQTVPVAVGPAALPPQRPEPVPHLGNLVFVIDDAGNNLRELEPFLRFPGPLTIAVLPGLPNSAEAARRIRAAGKEVLLHQPMEAIGGQDPGPGGIYMGMSAGEVREALERNLAEVGPVAGINNHQGSRITMDQGMMETVLALCREQGIYFLDSRTTADTAAPAAAKRMGLKIGERDVFLDNIQEKASMIQYVGEGLQKAQRTGAAVMIGHTWSNELAATLEELYPELIEQGYSLSTISRYMMGIEDDEGPWD
jgi:polysaccharide deacetylase 2 family uncharacterized protein YibQ